MMFGVVGYCYGAKHVIDWAKDNAIPSAVVAHPSRIVIPGDLYDLIARLKAPLLINSREVSGRLSQYLGKGIEMMHFSDRPRIPS